MVNMTSYVEEDHATEATGASKRQKCDSGAMRIFGLPQHRDPDVGKLQR